MKKLLLLMLVALTAVSGAKADYPATLTLGFEKTSEVILNALDQTNGIYFGSVTTTDNYEQFWFQIGETWYGDDKSNSNTLATGEKQNCWAQGDAGTYKVYIDLKNMKWHCYQEGASDASISMGTENWMTYYSEYAYIMPEGLTGYIITGVSAGKLVKDNRYTSGTLVPRWQGVLLNGNEGSYTLKFTNSTAEKPSENRISGKSSAGTVNTWQGNDSQNVYLYKLANDGTNGLGWYWGAENGFDFSCGANKGYLWLTQTEANNLSARGFVRLFADEVTGVEEVQEFKGSKVQDGQIYDLQGRFVAQPVKGHLYIVNGKKVVF